MEKLIAYLNSLSPAEQKAFALRCGTTVGYLRKAGSTGQRIGAELCINIERESLKSVVCEVLRPDIDWASIRHTAPASQAQEAINTVAEEAKAAILHVADTAEAEIKQVAEAQAAVKTEVTDVDPPVKLPPLASTEVADSLVLDERRKGLPTRRLKQQPFTGPNKRVGPPDRRGFKLPEVTAVLPKGV